MIENAILQAITQFSLLEENSTVTVALSGGADSMALLTALYNVKDKLHINVKAAHLNHLIRGDEALRDEMFAKEQCEKLGVEFICERIDIPKIAKNNKQSLELSAREVRYDFLKRINEGVIATAHTASDNLETVILNLTRGASIDGLCGIPIKRDIFIRPLLYVTREEIEKYCENNNIPYITDSTNLSDDYTRNKIRHLVIPTLKSINPSVENTISRTSDSLKEISKSIKAETFDYINANLENKILNLKDFSLLKPHICKRVIIEFVKICDNSISLEKCHIEEIYKICISGGKTNIPHNKFCVSKNGILKVVEANNSSEKLHPTVKITEKFLETFDFDEKINNLFLNNSLDCDKIVGKLIIRTRQSGDSIRLKNRGCTKSLTKLYNESGIPVDERDLLPVICDNIGVVWIYKIGVAHRCAINDKTKKAYVINVSYEES